MALTTRDDSTMQRVYVPAALLLMTTSALMLTRMTFGGVRLEEMRPAIKYYVTLQMEAALHGGHAVIKTYLPASGVDQTVENEKVESSHLAYSLETAGPNRRGVWTGRGLAGREIAVYDAKVAIHPKRYVLPEGVALPPTYPRDVLPYLQASDTIQSGNEEIRRTAAEVLRTAGATDVAGTIRALFDFVHDKIAASEYENTLDALTTLKWKEAFCGGKSRLLAALLRASNIPARMVGGLILSPGSKRVSHAWIEAWVNGQWVPFDALNGHFAEHPANFLILYYGDQVLFSRTSKINFQYHFNVRRWRTSPDESLDPTTASLLNPYVFWHAFSQAQISLNLLRIILLLPVGVLVIVLFRNVVGLTTFGTFHPALMAVAFRETGFLWGALMYLALLLIGMGLRRFLDRFQLLHTPRVAILLVFVVVFMLGATYLAVRAGEFEAAQVSLFPIAILALTVERFFRTAAEQGHRRALSIVAQTLAVGGTAFAVMNDYRVQSLIFVFPEILFALVAAYLVLGRWTGMRLTEYTRFRVLFEREIPA